jgi:hypothetical protein
MGDDILFKECNRINFESLAGKMAVDARKYQ